MIELLLVAAALGLSNFAAAIGIGMSGVDRRTRWRTGVVFGLFETAMPIVGLALGHAVADSLGHVTRWIGAGLLIATGAYALWQARGGPEQSASSAVGFGQSWGRLLVSGLALSVDNLAVGFSLGSYRVGLLTAALVIGAVSVALTLLGLELGGRLGAVAGQRGELLGGAILVGVGVAVAAGAL
ncbi:manganese efflux pump MntP family protein [Streptacidiphilus jiangxiensis]|uniref:Putative Mn2+ efflux pump MntP n=1 Tax=Streptacidiphilus jiangxiensis TaxID=235985 RepID=A0A1H7QTE6_STRJI|nr:manganese efflux pump [Streptacidiphilus jiangxiensis]SEL51236.1 Putative Mn2+ efflux pump MntP [Streptacidiphilus jiangxiensis]